MNKPTSDLAVADTFDVVPYRNMSDLRVKETEVIPMPDPLPDKPRFCSKAPENLYRDAALFHQVHDPDDRNS